MLKPTYETKVLTNYNNKLLRDEWRMREKPTGKAAARRRKQMERKK